MPGNTSQRSRCSADNPLRDMGQPPGNRSRFYFWHLKSMPHSGSLVCASLSPPPPSLSTDSLCGRLKQVRECDKCFQSYLLSFELYWVSGRNTSLACFSQPNSFDSLLPLSAVKKQLLRTVQPSPSSGLVHIFKLGWMVSLGRFFSFYPAKSRMSLLGWGGAFPLFTRRESSSILPEPPHFLEHNIPFSN